MSNFISSSLKLLQHPDRLENFRDGYPRPITVECAPTDVCQLDCSYCSVMYRPKNVLDIELLERALGDFCSLGAKAVVFTGGGDPTLYPGINQILYFCQTSGIEVGMITNGLELRRIENQNLTYLTWLRISLNLDQERSRAEKMHERLASIFDFLETVPEKIAVTVGFSFVSDGNEEKFQDVVAFTKQYPYAKYVRIVGNCIGDIDTRKKVAEKMQKMVAEVADIESRFFFSYKLPEAPKGCYLGYLKPFLYADGYVYPCSSCVLGEQRFPERFRMYHASKVREFYCRERSKSIVDPTCSFCVLTEQNNFLTSLKEPMQHANFI